MHRLQVKRARAPAGQQEREEAEVEQRKTQAHQALTFLFVFRCGFGLLKKVPPCRVWFLTTTIIPTNFSSLALGSLYISTQPPIELGWLFGCRTPKRTAGGAVRETTQRPGFMMNHGTFRDRVS